MVDGPIDPQQQPDDPGVHAVAKDILFTIHLGDMTIDIKEAVVMWFFSVFGTWLIAHSKLDPESVQTWVGAVITAVFSTLHLRKVHTSNVATEQFKTLVDQVVKR